MICATVARFIRQHRRNCLHCGKAEVANPPTVSDWWKPDPEDPFWMLEAEDGEWLKNGHSLLGTRDACKALRFPTEQDAYKHPARMKAGSKWWTAKPTEHLWISHRATLTKGSGS